MAPSDSMIMKQTLEELEKLSENIIWAAEVNDTLFVINKHCNQNIQKNTVERVELPKSDV